MFGLLDELPGLLGVLGVVVMFELQVLAQLLFLFELVCQILPPGHGFISYLVDAALIVLLGLSHQELYLTLFILLRLLLSLFVCFVLEWRTYGLCDL